MKKKYTILVTGATGFVGANLARRLLKENYEVHIITRKTSNLWRIGDILPYLYKHPVDLRNPTRLTAVVKKIRPQIIFHLAAAGVYGDKHLSEKELIEINLLGTLNLINACDNLDYKCFFNTGSSSEYGTKDKPMRECDICEPNNIYGVTKLASTLYGQTVAKMRHRPIVCFRLFSPFGPFDDKRKLVTYAINNALQNKPLNLANPLSVRDYIYIDDVLDLYMGAIAKAKKFCGQVFNVGSGYQIKISYIVKEIIRLTRSTSKVNWHIIRGRDFGTKRWQADIGNTKEFFGWEPRYSIEEGLIKTINFYINQKSS